MRSRRKRQNKRHRRNNVLDVKLRSDHIRALRARGLAVVLGVLFGTVFTCYILWRSADWAMDRLIYENNAFAVADIHITTDGSISSQYLLSLSRVRQGQNLMALDLSDIKARLEALPNIERVAVERVLPTSLRIRVTERQPVARVEFPRLTGEGGLVMQRLLFDREGMVMMPLDPRMCVAGQVPSDRHLPELTGFRPTEMRVGRLIDARHAQAALSFVDGFHRSGMGTRVRLVEVRLGDAGVVVATTADGAEVTFGADGFERQLARWRSIHDDAIRRRKRIVSLDLAVENNVPLFWVDREDPFPAQSAS